MSIRFLLQHHFNEPCLHLWINHFQGWIWERFLQWKLRPSFSNFFQENQKPGSVHCFCFNEDKWFFYNFHNHILGKISWLLYLQICCIYVPSSKISETAICKLLLSKIYNDKDWRSFLFQFNNKKNKQTAYSTIPSHFLLNCATWFQAP